MQAFAVCCKDICAVLDDDSVEEYVVSEWVWLMSVYCECYVHHNTLVAYNLLDVRVCTVTAQLGCYYSCTKFCKFNSYCYAKIIFLSSWDSTVLICCGCILQYM